MLKRKYSPLSLNVKKQKRSGPYVWEYVRSPGASVPVKKMRSHKRRGLANVPQSAMNIISTQLGRNVGKLYLTSPKYVRSVLQPSMNTQHQIAKLRGKLTPRFTRTVHPGYISIVRRLQEINGNNNFTRAHVNRIQRMQKILERLYNTSGRGRYSNNRNDRGNYVYHKKGGVLYFDPHDMRRIYKVAKGVSKRPNGTLFFNLRKRRERQRTHA